MRHSPFPRLLLLILCTTILARSQSTNATLSGVVVDPSGKVIQDADIEILNEATRVHYSSRTNESGIYTVSILPPGNYRMQVSKIGFKTIIKPGIVLNVQSAVALNFTLPVGAASESVSVDAGASTIDTTDGAVSTVIDGKFVENIPLNGRSLQDLILLSPGVITNSPQQTSAIGVNGEFSVNGQRTESNYYTVDGVSADSASSPYFTGAGITGSLPASTALGTTQSLVSVEALQEFRVESSTYSAEYGRSPGGQFAMVTRSGTNAWHGSTFDYFRNDALDANSWFNDDTAPVTPKSPERQNDFGGTFGGRVLIPHAYNGKDRTFFFISYEGLRLVEPTDVAINYVPTLALRESAPAPLNRLLGAFPLPTPGSPDLGSGVTENIAGYSSPSSLDSTSVRIDESLSSNTHLFFRFSDTPSQSRTRGTSANQGYSSPSVVTTSLYGSQTYTAGSTISFGAHRNNDLRVNFSNNDSSSISALDGFGGAQPLNLAQIQGIAPANGTSAISASFNLGAYGLGLNESRLSSNQKQWNVVDAFMASIGKHQLKMGLDWRRLSAFSSNLNPQAVYEFLSEASVEANSLDIGLGISNAPVYPVFKNLSLFLQDEWRAGSRLNLSLGIRWDLNPAPGVSSGLMPYTVSGLNNLSRLTLAPEGTPLWHTTWYNLAPRLGFAYILRRDADREAVMRGGGGVFFDTGQQTGSNGFSGPGFSAYNYFGTLFGSAASFPATLSAISPRIVNPPTTPYDVPITAYSPHLQLPYAFQWNASFEQALGRAQSFTISYVGANGRRLLEQTDTNSPPLNPQLGNTLALFTNGLSSSYNALQLKFQRQIVHGLQTLAAYTWSHALDSGSFNEALPYQRGNSDQDVRNNLTGAISYDLPSSHGHLPQGALLAGWGIDGRLTARGGFPVTLNGRNFTNPDTGQSFHAGLDLNPSAPFYLYSSQFPGGRSINPGAFHFPAAGTTGDAPRNFARGFDAIQVDIALRREFPIIAGLHGQFRAEAFNVANHPNFGTIDSIYGQAQFGQATASLAQSLGVLSPLYQMGGSRSIQLALRIQF